MADIEAPELNQEEIKVDRKPEDIYNEPLDSDIEDELFDQGLKEDIRQIAKRKAKRTLIVTLVLIPVILIPLIVLFATETISFKDITNQKFSESSNFWIKTAQINLFVAACIFAFSIIDLAFFSIAYKMQAHQALKIRRYIVATLMIFTILIIGGTFFYQSTLLQDVELISQYVKSPSNASKAKPEPINPKTFGIFYVGERILITMMILTVCLLVEKIIIEKLQSAFHKLSISSRLQKLNDQFNLLARCYRRIKEVAPLSFFAMRAMKKHEADLDVDDLVHIDDPKSCLEFVEDLFKEHSEFDLAFLKTKLNDLDAELLFEWLSENGKLNKEISIVKIKILSEQRSEAKIQLKENSRIVKKLHSIFICIFLLIGSSLCSPFFELGVSRFWAMYALIMGALGFFLKGAARSTFEALMLLFIRHPYDYGDIVVMDNNEYKVVSILIFTTQFEKISDKLLLYVPNSQMMDKYITNLTRFPKIQSPL